MNNIESIDSLSCFPSFVQNKEYLYILEKVKEYEEIRKKIISEIQADCQHEFQNKFKDKSSIFGPEILESKTCKHCGLQQEKPTGDKYEICEKCWGEMKWNIDERTEAGKARHTIYKCKSCQHIIDRTYESI
jgi:hypothetical protein